MEKYKVVKEFNNKIYKNPALGSVLIKKGDELFDENNNWICEMGSPNHLQCTELITMNELKIVVNGVTMLVYKDEFGFNLKPITDVPNLKEYEFSMGSNITIDYFLSKLDDVSQGVNRYIKQLEGDESNDKS